MNILEPRPLAVGYSSVYNAKARKHQFAFWDLGQCVMLESDDPFVKGGAVQIYSIDPVDHVVRLQPGVGRPEEALLFMAPKIPLAADDNYDARVTDCELVHMRPVRLSGNQSIIVLAAIPLVGRCAITLIERVSRNRMHFFMTGE